MNVYIDISRMRTDDCDWSVPCYGGTYMQFNKLKEVPEGSFQVLCDPFPIDDKAFHCTHKILVCSTKL